MPRSASLLRVEEGTRLPPYNNTLLGDRSLLQQLRVQALYHYHRYETIVVSCWCCNYCRAFLVLQAARKPTDCSYCVWCVVHGSHLGRCPLAGDVGGLNAAPPASISAAMDTRVSFGAASCCGGLRGEHFLFVLTYYCDRSLPLRLR